MLNKKQKLILDFINKFEQKHGHQASAKQIQKRFKFASVSSAYFYLKKFKSLDFLNAENNLGNIFEVLDKPLPSPETHSPSIAKQYAMEKSGFNSNSLNNVHAGDFEKPHRLWQTAGIGSKGFYKKLLAFITSFGFLIALGLGSAAIAAVTISGTGITGDSSFNSISPTASTIVDVGAANTLSLQTTNNGPVTLGSGLFTVGGTSSFTGTSTFANSLTIDGAAILQSSLNQSGGLASLGATTISGNATATNLSVTGLASSGNPCLTIGNTGVVATSTCASGGNPTIAGLTTSTFTLNGTGSQVIVATSAPGTINLSLPQSIATISSPTFAGMNITGVSTTTNLSVSGLASSGSPCLTIGNTGVVATTTCASGSGITAINGLSNATTSIAGTLNQIIVATSSPNVINLSLPQAIGTGSSPTFAALNISGVSTTTNLSVTGLASSGSPCLTISNTGLVATTTCASSLSNLSQNADGSDNGAKAITSAAPTIVSGPSATCDWSQSNSCTVTASGSTTVTFSHPHGAGTYILGLCNDGSAESWSFSPVTPNNVVTPVVASACTYQILQYDGSTNYQGLSAVSTELPSILRGTERSAPAAAASGKAECWWDSTNHVFTCNDNASGVNTVMVASTTAIANTFVTGLSAAGVFSTQAISAVSPITLSGGGAIGFAASPTLGTTTVAQLTLQNVASGTQCLQANGSGVITGTGSGCGGGSGITAINGLSNATTSIAGTLNQIIVATSSPNIITLSLPQSIATTSSVSFAALNISGVATATSLSITGLASSGSPCLTIGTTGVVATSTCSGSFSAGGDLSGTASSQTVIALQGFSIATTSPGNGQVLAYNTTTNKWGPTGAGSGTITNVNGVTSGAATITTTGTANQIDVSNGSSTTPTLSLDSNVTFPGSVTVSAANGSFVDQPFVPFYNTSDSTDQLSSSGAAQYFSMNSGAAQIPANQLANNKRITINYLIDMTTSGSITATAYKAVLCTVSAACANAVVPIVTETAANTGILSSTVGVLIRVTCAAPGAASGSATIICGLSGWAENNQFLNSQSAIVTGVPTNGILYINLSYNQATQAGNKASMIGAWATWDSP